MTVHRPQRSLLLAALLIATSASSAPPAGPKTQVWIDAATHSMVGMPDMGAMGGFAAKIAGGGQNARQYPETRMPMATGKYLDVALYNGLQPGVEAEQRIPAGLGLGSALPLVPPVSKPQSSPEGGQYKPPDGQMRLLFYWGCGSEIRPGQPREFSISAKDGKVEFSGNPQQGRYAPDRGIDPDPSYALWPNRKTRQGAPANASLVGPHQILGPGVPESLKFELQPVADFMPAIALTSRGSLGEGPSLSWQPVDRAKAYFLHAVGSRGKDVVFWSSAEVPDAGQGMFDYLTGSTIERWLKEKVLLPTSTTSCRIPKGVFADAGEQGGGGLLSMIAYGPETHLAWPPKPADPKQAWNPEWNVRVRTKSTAGAILGIDLTEMENADPQDSSQQPEENQTKKLLRGLLRKL